MKKIALLSVLALGVASLAAVAAEHMPTHPMFDLADANGDGLISREEFDAQRKSAFSEADADGSGGLSIDELTVMMEKKRAEHRAAMRERMFKHVDKDGNGEIGTEEFDAMGDKRFSRMDANGDGSVEPGEAKKGFHGRHGGKGHHGKGGPWHGGPDSPE